MAEGSSLINENNDDLERIQKAAVKLILNKPYTTYVEALEQIDLQSLKERREELCLEFAKCTKTQKVKHIFPLRKKNHDMDIRNEEKFIVKYAHTERLRNSAVPYMQRLLNEDCKNNKIK